MMLGENKRATLRFGVAGNPPHFWDSEFRKDRGYAPAWLRSIGLDALEIQCTYGVRTPDSRAALFREQADEHDIALSIHGPYYITLGTEDPQKRENSLRDLRKSIELAKKVGSRRVIFHPGGAGKDREGSLVRAIDALRVLEVEDEFGDVELFPEIAGKVGQLGSLEEILTICSEISHAWPCLDLAHLHAREGGSFHVQADYEQMFDRIEAALGTEAFDRLHIHMYPIEWGPKGEVRHISLEGAPWTDEPRYEPFLDILAARNLSATVICEAKNSQDIGALTMQAAYRALSP